MLNDIMSEIVNYIDFLIEKYNLKITLHDNVGILNKYYNNLVCYNIHTNEFCLTIKGNVKAWQKCQYKQKEIFRKCTETISFGMCYAGVEEFVIPVNKCGFISVSGYRKNIKKGLQRIDNLCEKYNLNKDEVLASYSKLSNNPPDIEFIKTVTMPIKRMLELAYMYVLEEQEGIIIGQTTNKNIYDKILAYLNANYNKKVSLQEISKFCYCSASYVSHIFKNKNGKTIKGYTNLLRINKAKKLLVSTNLPVKEIAYLVGFEDSNYFTNIFRLEYGESPIKYRKRFYIL
jgi:AraC-like DNA-binding protein